jgi:transposase
VNPARPLAYAKSLGIRDKSDRVDACVLALFGQATQPRPRSRPTQAQRHLRELSRTYQTISAEWQAHQQRLQSGLTSPAARTCLRTIMRAVAKQKGALEDEMKRLIAQDPVLKHDYKRAQTVKGIGPKTATVILAEFGDLRQYNRDELVALAGLYPREKTSGRSLRKKARLIKAGKAGVRAMLYMGAMNAVKYDPWLRAFARRLEAHGKQPMQILVAVMRKLLMIVRAVVIAEQDYDPNYQHASYCPAA